jgi:hypothetical protein
VLVCIEQAQKQLNQGKGLPQVSSQRNLIRDMLANAGVEHMLNPSIVTDKANSYEVHSPNQQGHGDNAVIFSEAFVHDRGAAMTSSILYCVLTLTQKSANYRQSI